MIWVALYNHKHGTNVYLFDHEPGEKEVIDDINKSGDEWEGEEEDESIDIRGPFDNPK